MPILPRRGSASPRRACRSPKAQEGPGLLVSSNCRSPATQAGREPTALLSPRSGSCVFIATVPSRDRLADQSTSRGPLHPLQNLGWLPACSGPSVSRQPRAAGVVRADEVTLGEHHCGETPAASTSRLGSSDGGRGSPAHQGARPPLAEPCCCLAAWRSIRGAAEIPCTRIDVLTTMRVTAASCAASPRGIP